MALENLKTEFVDLFLTPDTDKVVTRAKEVLDGGVSAADFFQSVFTPAMEAVGDKFGNFEIYLAELILAAENAQAVSESAVEPVIKAHGAEIAKRGMEVEEVEQRVRILK